MNLHPVVKKVVRGIKFTVIGLVVFFLLTVGAVNLPFVHKILTNTVNNILADKGLPIHAGKLTLLINGNIGLSRLQILTAEGDTIVSAANVSISFRPIPLLSGRLLISNAGFKDVDINLVADNNTGELNLLRLFRNASGPGKKDENSGKETNASRPWEIDVDEIHLENIRFLYNDPTAGLFVQQKLEKADLELDTISLTRHKIDIGYLGIKGSRGVVEITEGLSQKNTNKEPGSAWQFSLRKLETDDILFGYKQPGKPQQISISLLHGLLNLEKLDLARKQLMVSRLELDEPDVGIKFSGSRGLAEPNDSPATETTTGNMWSLSVNTLNVKNGTFSYLDTERQPGELLAEYLPVKNFNTAVRNFKFSRHGYELTVSDLFFSLNQKINLRKGGISFRADSALRGELTVDLTVEADEQKSWFKKNAEFGLSAAFSGSPDSLQIEKFGIRNQKADILTLSGYIRDIIKFPESSCRLNFHTGEIRREEVKKLLEVVNSSFKLPEFQPFSIEGSVGRSLIQPEITLNVNSRSGIMKLVGDMELAHRSGRAEVTLSDVNIGELTGNKDLGAVSGSAEWMGTLSGLRELNGKGFLLVDSLIYKQQKFRNFRLDASAQSGEYKIDFFAADSAVNGVLAAVLSLKKGSTGGKLDGKFEVDAKKAGLVSTPLTAKGSITADLHYSGDSIGAVVKLKDLALGNRNRSELIKTADFLLNLTDRKVVTSIESDFLTVDFQSSNSFQSLKDYFSKLNLEKIFKPTSDKIIDIQQFEQFPGFLLAAQVNYHPVFQLYMPDSIFSFKQIRLSAGKKNQQGNANGEVVSDRMTVNNVDVYGAKLDFLLQPDRLNAGIILDSMAAGSMKADSSYFTLKLLPDKISSEIRLTKGKGQILYDIGAEMLKKDNRLVLRSSIPDWTLYAGKWTLTPAEFLVTDAGFNDMSANLHLVNDNMKIDLSGNKSENLCLNITDVAIHRLLPPGLVRYLPEGKLNATVDYRENKQKTLDFSFTIQEVKWEDLPIEKVSGKGNLLADTAGIQNGNMAVQLNDTSRIDLRYVPRLHPLGSSLQTSVENLPFRLLGPFLKDYADNLEGFANGELSAGKENDMPVLNGNLRMKQVSIHVIPLNSWFSIPQESVEIKSNKLYFSDFEVLDSLSQPLKVNGIINLEDPGNMTADLRIVLDKLRVMNTSVRDNPVFSGSVVLNSDLTIKGALMSPAIRGNLSLENGTDITYRQIEDLNVKATQKNILFARLDGNRVADVKTVEKVSRLTKLPSIQAAIEINPKSIFNLVVSKGFEIIIRVTGGGMLNYSTMPNGINSLTGSYEIASGTTDVKFPGWPNKSFQLTPGSKLLWNGSMEDPELKLEATTRVKGTYVNPIDNKSRTVDFIVALKLNDRFSTLGIAFEIKSTDQYMTSVLNSLSADEQMRQAVNLVLFGAIDLPQMQSSTNYVAAQMAGFWESQLNSFTKTSLKKVDLSFGIDSHTQTTANGGTEEKTNLTYNLERKMLRDRASVKLSGRLTDDTNTSSQANTMIENFSFEYALDTIGTRFLKLYKNMDYENILEGEIIKSGIGFRYHRNYARMKDIWHRNEKKKKKKGYQPADNQ